MSYGITIDMSLRGEQIDIEYPDELEELYKFKSLILDQKSILGSKLYEEVKEEVDEISKMSDQDFFKLSSIEKGQFMANNGGCMPGAPRGMTVTCGWIVKASKETVFTNLLKHAHDIRKETGMWNYDPPLGELRWSEDLTIKV